MNGDIPWTAVDAYARRHEMDGDDFFFFERVIGSFEQVRRILAKRQQEATKKPDSKQVH